MKTKMKYFVTSLMLLVAIAFGALGMTACGNANENHLISVSIGGYLGTTKKEYYCGEAFSPSETIVTLKYYDKEKNTEYTLNSYTLPELKKKISDIKYEVTGFDSSQPVDSQTVTLTFTSESYSGEISTTLNVKILPECVISSELVDEDNTLKESYVLNEQLSLEGVTIRQVYSNGRVENVPVTIDMVSGFDTSVSAPYKKTMKIAVPDKEFSVEYVVIPTAGYKLYSKPYVKCFIPTEELGWTTATASQPEVAEKWAKADVGDIEIGYYQKFTVNETQIKLIYSTSGNILKPNVTVTLCEDDIINGVNVTRVQFKYTNSTTVYNAIYFTRNVTFSNGYSTVTGERTMEIIARGSSTEMIEVFNTVINSIR